MLDSLVNLIYSSGSRFQQASTGNHGIKGKRNASLLQRIVHTLATVLILFINMVKAGQLLGRMRNAFTPDRILILVDCQLRRSGARLMTSIFIRSSFILFVSLPDMPVPDCSTWSFRSHSAKALLPVQWYRSAYLPYSHHQTETGFCKTYCPILY